jgi:hypothetical protein
MICIVSQIQNIDFHIANHVVRLIDYEIRHKLIFEESDLY